MNACIVLKDIRHREDGTVCLCIKVGNEFGNEHAELVILDELISGMELEIGIIDAARLDLLDRMSQATAAFRSACASLAYTQSSHKALSRKLFAKGHSREACELAIELIRQRGYISESDVAVRRAEIMVGKPWGKNRILSKLCEEGFEAYAIEDAREYLLEIDFSENCGKLISKKYRAIPQDRHEREKMYASLMRLGFSTAEIKAAIAELSDR